jgi:secreted trypsin-like serine protease
MRKGIRTALLACALGFGAAAASANVVSVSSLPAGSYAASPYIVGTGDINSATYLTPRGVGYDGVAGLILTTDLGSFLCTGALLADGISVLTAAHCVTDEHGQNIFNAATATFFPSGTTAAETIAASEVFIHPGWDGDIFGGDDLAILRLSSAPSAGVQRYDIYTGTGDVGGLYDVVGFGARGSNGAGFTLPAGSRRHGFNTFDAALLDELGKPTMLLSDFDSGLAANDAFGVVFGFPPHLGVGLGEVSTAPGDSGGPAFINGAIAGITSFGLTFLGAGTPDAVAGLNSSFGEFNGFTRVSAYTDWIRANTVPEPSSLVLLATLLLALAVAGRRRRARH